MGLRKIDGPYLVLCEGMHDVQFFDHLLVEKQIPKIQATSCGNVVGVTGPHDGISHLTGALDALPSIPGFSRLEAILIAADNDSDATASFLSVQKLINATVDIAPGQRYAAPLAPQKKAGARPEIVVLMIPWTGVRGALDSLCLEAASSKRPTLAASVSAFASAVNVDDAHGWAITKQHKMQLRSLISAAYMSDPYLAPAWVWNDGTDLVPISDVSFNRIADFLRDFPTLLASP